MCREGREKRNRETTQTKETNRKVTTAHTADTCLLFSLDWTRAAELFTGTSDSRLKSTLDTAGEIRRGDALTRSKEICRNRQIDRWLKNTAEHLLTEWQQYKEQDGPPQDVVAADGAEGPEEDSGSRSNKELGKVWQGTEKPENISNSIISAESINSSLQSLGEKPPAIAGFNAKSVKVCILMWGLHYLKDSVHTFANNKSPTLQKKTRNMLAWFYNPCFLYHPDVCWKNYESHVSSREVT